jgi:rubrerythrin
MDTYPNQYIPKLILDYMSDELADSDFYKILASTVKEKDVEEILRNISIDEEKHYKMLKKIYESITGQPANVTDFTPEELSDNIFLNLDKRVMEELNAVENYRSLMFALSEQWIRDYLTEIYTDEQNHAAKLSFLYSKYLK